MNHHNRYLDVHPSQALITPPKLAIVPYMCAFIRMYVCVKCTEESSDGGEREYTHILVHMFECESIIARACELESVLVRMCEFIITNAQM